MAVDKDNFKVGLVYYICPICGAKADEAIVMNQKLTKREADKIAEMNHKCVGFSNKACDKCASRKDEMFFITCHETNNDRIRIKYCGVKHTSSFKDDVKDYICKTENGVEFVVCDEKTFNSIIHCNDN